MRAPLLLLLSAFELHAIGSPIRAHDPLIKHSRGRKSSPRSLDNWLSSPRDLAKSLDFRQGSDVRDSFRTKSFSPRPKFKIIANDSHEYQIELKESSDQMSDNLKAVYHTIERSISPLGLSPNASKLAELEIEWTSHPKRKIFLSPRALDPSTAPFIPHVGPGKFDNWLGVNFHHSSWAKTGFDIALQTNALTDRGEYVCHPHHSKIDLILNLLACDGDHPSRT